MSIDLLMFYLFSHIGLERLTFSLPCMAVVLSRFHLDRVLTGFSQASTLRIAVVMSRVTPSMQLFCSPSSNRKLYPYQYTATGAHDCNRLISVTEQNKSGLRDCFMKYNTMKLREKN